jgi:endoglucanase
MASSVSLFSKGVQGRRKLLESVVLAGFLLCSAALAHGDETAQLAIKVDQVGYPLNRPKVALVSTPAAIFEVRCSSDDVVVFKGKLTAAEADPDSGDKVQAADFSALKHAGRYYLEIPGVGRSWDFAIGSNVYEHTYYMAMRGFYGQRCGTAVDMGPEFPGYSHPACHLHGEFGPTSGAKGPRDNIGGWHDARADPA